MNKQSPCIWPTPKEHFLKNLPDAPVLYFAPHALKAKAQVFQQGFGGAVSYAVKANSRADVLRCLTEAGIGIFDVASPKEMQAVRSVNPNAMLNYHNPIRSLDESHWQNLWDYILVGGCSVGIGQAWQSARRQ